MTGIEKTRQLFLNAGLTFPTIPGYLASQIWELQPWLFTTRPIKTSPYNLQHYLREVEKGPVADYVILSHSGHGVNSYAIHYFIVQGFLRMFLQLGWGGVYRNNDADAAEIRNCFSQRIRSWLGPRNSHGAAWVSRSPLSARIIAEVIGCVPGRDLRRNGLGNPTWRRRNRKIIL